MKSRWENTGAHRWTRAIAYGAGFLAALPHADGGYFWEMSFLHGGLWVPLVRTNSTPSFGTPEEAQGDADDYFDAICKAVKVDAAARE